MARATVAFLTLLTPLALACLSLAGPITRAEGLRQAQVMEKLTKALAAEPTPASKFALLSRGMKEEPAVEVRRRMLDLAKGIPGPERETFLTARLTLEEDAGLRSQVATDLGRLGSEKCLAALARCAGSDRTTDIRVGSIGSRSSARRSATFAVADLVARFPKLADEAAAKLRALPAVADAKDNEGLADARVQALYRITRDKALLRPFFERLASADARDRERGANAFQFFALKTAPAELVGALKDTSPDVRRSVALVLGAIGDPKTGAALMATAANTKEDTGVRCNAVFALGRMKHAPAAASMEKLLKDGEPRVRTNAAVALYRITGKKVAEFPAGYRAD